MRFELGQIVATCSVHEMMQTDSSFRKFVSACMNRYMDGDWGDLCEEDRLANDDSLRSEGRILAAYENPNHPDWKIWIITEWDRSATTILFPSEY